MGLVLLLRGKELVALTDGEAVSDSNFVVDYFRLTADNRIVFGGRPPKSGEPTRIDYIEAVKRPVSAKDLSELLDVPLGPTREALKRLEAESLVRLIPQRGIQITNIGVSLIQFFLPILDLLKENGVAVWFDEIQTFARTTRP